MCVHMYMCSASIPALVYLVSSLPPSCSHSPLLLSPHTHSLSPSLQQCRESKRDLLRVSKMFILTWKLFTSKISREITLQNAPSFGRLTVSCLCVCVSVCCCVCVCVCVCTVCMCVCASYYVCECVSVCPQVLVQALQSQYFTL